MARSGWWLRAFARLLPREFRERVFEPAWADLQLDERQPAAAQRLSWVGSLVLVAECVRLGLPQYLWRRGRPTRLAVGTLALLVVVSLLVLRRNYAPWPPER